MESFCGGSEFWNTSLTWDTRHPDFTACFHKTVVSWTPTVVLLPMALWEVFYTYRTSVNKHIPFNWLNLTKLSLILAAFVFAVVFLILLAINGGDGVAPVDYTAAGVFALGFTVSAGLLLASLRYGVRSSPAQFIFYLLSTICGAMQLRSVFKRRNHPSFYELDADEPNPDRLDRLSVLFTLQFTCVVLVLLLNMVADSRPSRMDPSYARIQNPCPVISASFVSRLLFEWITPLLWRGFRAPLVHEDLWDMDPSNASPGIVPHFDRNFERSKKESEGTGKKKISLFPSLFRTFGPTFLFGSLLKVLADLLALASPQVMKLMIDYVTSYNLGELEEQFEWKGYFYALLLMTTMFLTTLLNAHSSDRMYTVSMNLRTALSSAVYRKALRMSNSAKRVSTVGEIVNLMAVDVQRFMDLVPYLNMLWSAPIQIGLCTFFIYNELGVAVFSGFAVLILAIPLNAVAAGISRRFQLSQMLSKDKRVKLMNEILSGIKVLKLYGWEESFMQQVLDIRSQEIAVLKKSAWLSALISLVWNNIPILFALAAFTSYIFIDSGNILTADKAFVTLSYINILKIPMVMLPYMIIGFVQVRVSLTRLNGFMNGEDLDDEAVNREKNEEVPVSVTDGVFNWDKSDQATLRDINVEVKKNSLTAIVGPVGSGKSSLVAALLGEMEKESGKVCVSGRVAYVPQQAWMRNCSVEDNILFGKKQSRGRYNAVVDACALRSDLEMLPGGDQTEIGEKGINLSGGQKQRVSLARAVYNDADIYLLDDPLSAVDSHVGKHIFENVIGDGGLLENKTRILVTHAITYLPKTDHIIVMKWGRVSEQGSYKELLARKGDFAEFLLEHMTNEIDDGEEEEGLEDIKAQLEDTIGKGEFQKQVSVIRQRKDSTLGDDGSVGTPATVREKSGMEVDRETKEAEMNKEAKGAKLIEKETAETGGVKAEVYMYYIKNIGLFGTVMAISMMATNQAAALGSSFWLTAWTENKLGNSTVPKYRNLYLGVYGGLGAAQAAALLFASVIIMMTTLTASKKMHGNMLGNILRTPMSFFDTTPLGRVVNRFAKDVDICDNTLPMGVQNTLNFGFQFLGTVVLILTVIPIFGAVIVPVAIVFYFVQKIFITTSRQLKRLESISRSPIYSHFGETITGSATIRAFNVEGLFIKESEDKVDSNQVCYYSNQVINRWLAVRLESLGNIITFCAALLCISAPDAVNPSEVGLIINYALSVTQILNYLVRMLTELETNIVAVERIREYTSFVETEAPWVNDKRPEKNWPQDGRINFRDYGIRYRPGLDLVLKGITCDIKGGETIGIVGRTGAGKSTLTVALFRLVEAAQGSILVDDVDIGGLGLHDLRKRLTIIPQDPVLFSGTLRINLDPFNVHSDEAIWNALELAHLRDFATTLGDGLSHEVSEGGENLSVGQRQLLCLARALLRKTKVLILDEATAAVDLETDDLIQATIRKEFRGCTVLTIAHRLNTILDYDRIMVLDKGLIKEFAAPQDLLADTQSIFYSMAKDANLV